MTYQDAYLDGFCKAAEAAGVDPVALYKKAAAKTKLLSRFMELLRGGNARVTSPLRAGTFMGQFPQPPPDLKGRLANRLKALLGREFDPSVTKEVRKSLATQVGTGLAGAGALTGAGYGINSALSNN